VPDGFGLTTQGPSQVGSIKASDPAAGGRPARERFLTGPQNAFATPGTTRVNRLSRKKLMR
jgi:hypothetical protein